MTLVRVQPDDVAATAVLVWGEVATGAGRALLALGRDGICWLDPGCGAAARAALRAAWPAADLQRDDAAVGSAWAAAVTAVEHGTGLRLQVQGTDFQCAVWRALLRIPPGRTLSYGELATVLGKPRAARAVGSAAAANRIAFLIPCHRLLPATGAAGAYRWGDALKRSLLSAEARSGLSAGVACAVLAA